MYHQLNHLYPESWRFISRVLSADVPLLSLAGAFDPRKEHKIPLTSIECCLTILVTCLISNLIMHWFCWQVLLPYRLYFLSWILLVVLYWSTSNKPHINGTHLQVWLCNYMASWMEHCILTSVFYYSVFYRYPVQNAVSLFMKSMSGRTHS